jgi:3-deoxy-manno-octulosonate cytidylyltransferase (CMP-KDO synthetase)
MAFSGKPKVLAVIPARHGSSRFPGKVIAPLAGKPLVAHTFARTVEASLVSEAVVAVDDDRVAAALEPYGIPVVMTKSDHASGTDRIAEVMGDREGDIVVNVQGDEPLIDPAVIDKTIQPLIDDPETPMATARHLITDPERVADPNVVKVVCTAGGRALYFSRSPIPYIRDEADRAAVPQCYWQHVGIYVYRRDFLLDYAGLETSLLEDLEKLEQLRVLENGFSIAVVDTEYECIGVDSPEDLERVAAIMSENE